jgi:hypothetical protein
MFNFNFLWDEDATEDEILAGYQILVDTGLAWRLEGHIGRSAGQTEHHQTHDRSPTMEGQVKWQ